MQQYGIHWFRRDLRIAGNRGLSYNYQQHQGRVLGVFCIDEAILEREDFSANRFHFFLKTLKALKEELTDQGGDLLILNQVPKKAFQKLLELVEKWPTLVTWCRDYEPFARERDQSMETFFRDKKVSTKTFRDHLLIEPWELSKQSNDDPYKVYTPFSKRWLELFEGDDIHKRILGQQKGLGYLQKRLKNQQTSIHFDLTWQKVWKDCPIKISLSSLIEKNFKQVTLKEQAFPEAGSLRAFTQLKAFEEKLDDYQENRDIPFKQATSELSPFLKNGSLTTLQIISFLQLKSYHLKHKDSRATFFSELIWREFYYHILYHWPQVEKEAFNSDYNEIEWENDQKLFEAWKQGRTGFPIVDAGMRELNQTGLMHNRVRMIVSSFLVKDLLIDWRWGERYFMEKLLDGDLAANNGGWQWSASTGCDAQPYFRVFNPWLQSKKFDPEGEYIKRHIPELRDISSKRLHQPIVEHAEYPTPIVEHSERRKIAIELFKKV